MNNHIKKYMIHHTEIENYMEYFNNDDSLYCFDTESCFINDNLKYHYENKKVIDHKCNVVRVYAWALSNTSNDYVVYGEEIYSFFETVNKICFSKIDLNSRLSDSKIKTMKSKMKGAIRKKNFI